MFRYAGRTIDIARRDRRYDRGLTMDAAWEDFTEDAYRRIVRSTRQRYTFEPFAAASPDRAHVLWRHDVDFSVHRALALAKIEADEGVRSTFLLSVRGPFYNVLEPAVLSRIREIAGLGHWLGLHFDLGAHPDTRSTEALTNEMALERDLLSEVAEQPIDVVSFHNPGATGAESIDDDELAGMTNAYGKRIRDGYAYVSDSNGYWRHERLADVVESREHERIHVLTHPEWWQAEPMSPRARLERCLEGRTEHAREWYLAPTRAFGRETPD
jgi:hypothetical protein